MILLTFVCLTSPFLSAEKTFAAPPSLAVLDIVSGSISDRELAAAVAETVRLRIAASGAYVVMDRGKTETTLKRRGLPAGCIERRCAAEAGRALNTAKVIFGNLNKVGGTRYLSLSRLSVADQTVEFVVEDKSPGGTEEMARMTSRLTDKLLGIEEAPLRQTSAPEETRFERSPATIYDKEKGLLWLRDADSAGKALPWEEANEHIRRLNKQQHAGFGDWRLPEKNELAVLVEYANSQGAKSSLGGYYKTMGFNNVREDVYWTATLSDEMSGLAWALDLYSGSFSTAVMGGPGYVWPVRSGVPRRDGR